MGKKEEMEGLLKFLDSINTDDFETFQVGIDKSLTVLKIENKDFARNFGVSIPTVDRWRNGHSAPVKSLRQTVIDYVKNLCKEKISSLKG